MRSTFDRFTDIVLGICPRWLRSERALFFIILGVGVAVRLIARDSVPNGFNNDEASLGYDAYSILKFGVDRHGIAYPAFLIGWGSGMNALAAYLAMPFIAIFGLTEGAVRAANLTGALVSLVVFYSLVRRIADGKTALWGTFLLSLCPWHVMLSRFALESNLLPSMFLLAVWLLVRGTERARFFSAAAICFALCLYAYGTAYFAVPVFLFLASIYLLWTRQIAWPWLGLSVLLFAAVATPIAAVIWANQKHVASFRLAGIGVPLMTTVARYTTVSSIFGQHALQACWDNLRGLWNLLVKQDDSLIWNTIPGQGLLFPFGIAFALVGVCVESYGPWKWRTFQPRMLMLLWLATAVALGAVQSSNVNRINLIWLPLVYFAGVGLRTVARNRFMTAALVVTHLALFASFTVEYFGSYRDRTAGAYYPGYGKAIRAASRSVSGPICATNNPCFSYAFVLFYDRSDPREFYKTAVYENDGSEFESIKSFGRYTFGTDRCPDDTAAWILDNGDVARFRSRADRVETFGNYSVAIAKGH